MATSLPGFDQQRDLAEIRKNRIVHDWSEKVGMRTGSIKRVVTISYFSYFYDSAKEMKKTEKAAGRDLKTSIRWAMTPLETHYTCDQATSDVNDSYDLKGIDPDKKQP